MRALVMVFGLFLLTPLPARAAGGVPLKIDARGGIQVAVAVNGAGPFSFLLDTGTARSVVSAELARDVAAPVVAQSELVTSAGTEMRMVVRLASVELAAARAGDLIAPTVEEARLSQLGRGVRGVLGQDFLSAFNYTLDYRRSRLTWDDGVACDGSGAVPLVAAEGRFVMALRDERGEPLRLVPDSGAEIAVLFSERGNRPTVRTVTVNGLASARTARLVTLPMLRAGQVQLRDVAAVVAERADPAADGLLPLHAFSSVTFAAGGACVVPRSAER